MRDLTVGGSSAPVQCSAHVWEATLAHLFGTEKEFKAFASSDRIGEDEAENFLNHWLPSAYCMFYGT